MTDVARTMAPWRLRAVGSALLVFATLFYLQFAAQAITNSLSQAALTFVATAALGWAAFRVARGQRAAGIVSLYTMPLLVFQIVATLLIPDESPVYIYGAGVAPILAGLIWLVRRLRSGSREGTSES